MSKLRRQLRSLGRTTAGVGFAPASRPQERSRQVLVIADVADESEAHAAADAGADVLLAGAGALSAVVAAAGTRPVGVRLDGASPEDVAHATEAGADFFIFDDARTPARALLRRPAGDQRDAPGRVLILDDDRSEQRLRSLALIDLDALLVGGVSEDLTVRDQIGLRRIVDLAGAPLMLVVPTPPSPASLEVWRDAGAPLVIVQAGTDAVRAAAEAAAQVPPPRQPRESRPPLVPFVAPAHEDDEF